MCIIIYVCSRFLFVLHPFYIKWICTITKIKEVLYQDLHLFYHAILLKFYWTWWFIKRQSSLLIKKLFDYNMHSLFTILSITNHGSFVNTCNHTYIPRKVISKKDILIYHDLDWHTCALKRLLLLSCHDSKEHE